MSHLRALLIDFFYEGNKWEGCPIIQFRVDLKDCKSRKTVVRWRKYLRFEKDCMVFDDIKDSGMAPQQTQR